MFTVPWSGEVTAPSAPTSVTALLPSKQSSGECEMDAPPAADRGGSRGSNVSSTSDVGRVGTGRVRGVVDDDEVAE